MKHFSLSYRLIFILLLAVLAASLIPLLMLMTTVVPSADDFAFGAAARTAFAATGSVPAALRAAGRMTLDVYRSWQGSFSAVFLMALTPAVFGDGFYALTPVLMLLSLLGGTFCLVTALLRRVFRLPRYAALCTAALLSLFTLQLMPAPEQGLYWYNGALYYTFYYGLALSAFALALSLLQEGGVWRSGLLCLLCLVLGGGNFITALNVSLLFVSAILLLALLRRPVWRRLLLPTLFLLAAFALSAAAPGNALRQSHMEHRPDALQAILSSFVHSSRDLVGFFLASRSWHAAAHGAALLACPAGRRILFPLPPAGQSLFLLPLFRAVHAHALRHGGEGRFPCNGSALLQLSVAVDAQPSVLDRLASPPPEARAAVPVLRADRHAALPGLLRRVRSRRARLQLADGSGRAPLRGGRRPSVRPRRRGC